VIDGVFSCYLPVYLHSIYMRFLVADLQCVTLLLFLGFPKDFCPHLPVITLHVVHYVPVLPLQLAFVLRYSYYAFKGP